VAAAGAPGPDDPQPLSEAEAAEKEALLGAGFSGWTRRDFASFTKACEKARGGPQARALHSLAGLGGCGVCSDPGGAARSGANRGFFSIVLILRRLFVVVTHCHGGGSTAAAGVFFFRN